jgi:hypothetical protein
MMNLCWLKHVVELVVCFILIFNVFLVSLGCIIVIAILIVNEFLMWWKVEVVSQLAVDDSPDDQIQINFDIVFPNIECRCLFCKCYCKFVDFKVLGVNIADKSGKILYNIWHNVHKHDIDLEGKEYTDTELRGFIENF